MPIYEYKCPKCEVKEEVIQRVGEDAPSCPECGMSMQKEISKDTTFILTGTGWYKTDYQSK